MGGHAFRSGPNPLNVVRLPTEQYIMLRDHYQTIVMKFYTRAVVPSEAPGKGDHGDIDVLVDEPLFNFTGQDLERALGAAAHTKAGRTSSFAIRIPEDSDNFFQLDVYLCKKGCFEWESVVHAYGDIWHIIGSTVTRFGLAINDSGLHARVQTEGTNKKDCLLLLTSYPEEMMKFLGLNGPRYDNGFSTLNELFEWAISMPLFRSKFFDKETVSGKQRRIREKRPMYSKFVTEWLPQRMTLHAGTAPPEGVECCDARAKVPISADASTSATAHIRSDKPAEEVNTGISPTDQRKDVLNKALLGFNKHEEYQKMLEDHRRRTWRGVLWKEVERVLPLQGEELGQAMMALKALLWWNDGQPRLRVEADQSLERGSALDADTVNKILVPWIKENWKEAVRLNERLAR
ncbi:hypothetical protein HO173_009287 [Letharia columbiana]|uniref:Uncharacterized protein n=1 Tax=Letharia columbiana TaxID=112416 RepID=A0A8H6FQ28_9LECA|nr:uncharacterized protein HO173_009287 [Letharia columbiana]KAF6232619.1 hypothetical protein HO173_009287 [Letharia columbiana]